AGGVVFGRRGGGRGGGVFVGRFRKGLEQKGFVKKGERRGGFPGGGGGVRSLSRRDRGPCPPSSRRHCLSRQHRSCACSEDGYVDNPDSLWLCRRSSRAWPSRESRAARWQRHRY